MTEIARRYFLWIMHSACSPSFVAKCNRCRVDIRAILTELHSISFESLSDMDLNRIDDGVNLRYRFGRSLDIPDAQIAAEIDIHECSALEVIAAMALRAGEEMFGAPYEKESAQWLFAKMLESAGMLDPKADVFDICDGILRGEYEPDGHGGLFYIPKCPKDLRHVELWGQMMLYLDVMYDEFMSSVKPKA